MPENYIVERHSPAWLSFDLEQSRGFLRSVGLDESGSFPFGVSFRKSNVTSSSDDDTGGISVEGMQPTTNVVGITFHVVLQRLK